MEAKNQYPDLKQKHQEEMNSFPFFFAFDNEQFITGMRKFGLAPDDTDKICKPGSTGGYLLRTDEGRFREMSDRHKTERQAALSADSTGDGYIYEMFLYELAIHEFTYTDSLDDMLDALNLTLDDIKRDPRLEHGLQKAIAELRRCDKQSANQYVADKTIQ